MIMIKMDKYAKTAQKIFFQKMLN
ncbi:hypothetical protein [Lactobacillus phage Maenad]|uniref:Uncharacterized protein n=1 Tax=Lactobacillus phage Maenad TaxID=2079431 RepID=A0A2P0ZL55_9CAUD|nr:hypothetical protein HOS85_gp098 [Lactobacillus phage Maenad]AVH85683.1 hypothetical protein [Lactobacillus phage Maenad]